MGHCRARRWLQLGVALGCLFPRGAANPEPAVDLAAVPAGPGLLRIYGASTGNGGSGVPVAGGHDVDGDGFSDYALSAMTNSSLSRPQNGGVYLVFGDGTIGGTLDAGVTQAGILRIVGAVAQEHAGSEVWIDDVTGDGLGDLLVCRQDYSPDGIRVGAGALSILPGGAQLRDYAATLLPLDLHPSAVPNPPVVRTTLVGVGREDRLGIWVRTGDLDGDAINDLAVGADRRTFYPGELGCQGVTAEDCDNGVVYVVRGGAHLASGETFTLEDFGSPLFGLGGEMAEIRPPAPAVNYHFGATVQIADLDGNGRAEVLIAAALNRAGAALAPLSGAGDGIGGPPGGHLYVAWDDRFPPSTWPAGYGFVVDANPAVATVIRGGVFNDTFGEELVGGVDWDGDQEPDLFIGDLTGDAPGRTNSGVGHVIYHAAELRGEDFVIDQPPAAVVVTTLYGPRAGAIGADTATLGDFDGDGLADLAIGTPHDQPLGRFHAGTIHVLYGRLGAWPALVDLGPGLLPAPGLVRIAEIYGARGAVTDAGDTLCYSAAAGDVDGDGRVDLITNEMLGNGPTTVDKGNLLVISGDLLTPPIFSDGFESGDTTAWSGVASP